MIYEKQQLKKLQESEKEILDAISKICLENNIEFFLAEGTLLGAIRHNDIIPWDDDIDIGMTRDNYEKFLKIAPKALPEKFVLQHFITEPNTATYFAKVRNKKTEFIEEHSANLKICKGIFVDIFPFDIVPSNESFFEKCSKKAKIKDQLFVSKTLWRASDFRGKSKKFILSILRKILHILLLPFPRKLLFKKLDTYLQSFRKDESSLYAYECQKMTLISTEEMYPLRYIKFGNKSYPCFNKSEVFLTRRYGNYLELPPEESRIGHAPSKLKFEDE